MILIVDEHIKVQHRDLSICYVAIVFSVYLLYACIDDAVYETWVNMHLQFLQVSCANLLMIIIYIGTRLYIYRERHKT